MKIRSKIFTVTTIISILLAWVLSYGRGVFDPLWLSIFIGLTVYVGVYWIVNFEVSAYGFIISLLPPALLAFFVSHVVQTGFAGFPTNSDIYLVVSTLFLFVLLYVSITTANIINTWTVKAVALAQVAATVFLFLSLVTFYFAFYALVSMHFLPVLLLGVVAAGGFLSFCNMWLAGIRLKDNAKLSVLISVVLTFFTVGLFFWPIPTEVYSGALASIFFVSTGIIIHSKKKTLDFWVWLEYLAVIFLVLGFIIATARWGVGGKF